MLKRGMNTNFNPTNSDYDGVAGAVAVAVAGACVTGNGNGNGDDDTSCDKVDGLEFTEYPSIDGESHDDYLWGNSPSSSVLGTDNDDREGRGEANVSAIVPPVQLQHSGIVSPEHPQHPETPIIDIDRKVAEEFTKLSLTEREKAMCDLHGVPGTLEDPPLHIQTEIFVQFQYALDHVIPVTDRTVYNMAVQMNPAYVERQHFRIMFLRSDFWDPCKAAVRFCKHFEVKLHLFGMDLLCRDISQDDLDPGTLEILYSSFIHDLPIRDTAGRIVHVFVPQKRWTPREKVRQH